MFLAGMTVLIAGILVGAVLPWYVAYFWLRQDPRRLGTVIRWIIEQLEQRIDGTFKINATLFDAPKASKVVVNVTPKDLCDAVDWYVGRLDPFSLVTNPAWPTDSSDDNRESKKDKG